MEHEQKPLRLGIIGLSEGNGHPYSWSAIFNGYDPALMAECEFKGIPKYLAEEPWPEARITSARVTSIWTQDQNLSRHIASASLIEIVEDRYEDMIDRIDALLLARDDFANHEHFARPFLEAGLPVYIDKPLANSADAARALLALQNYEGQIFTCSALRYSRAFAGPASRTNEIAAITAVTPKKWSTYAIHAIEPVVTLFPDMTMDAVRVKGKTAEGEKVDLHVEYEGVEIRFSSTNDMSLPLRYTVIYRDGAQKILEIKDTFHAFKTALQEFLRSIDIKKPVIPRTQTLCCIGMIEEGTHE